jgi:aspartyl-tRNA(Asn)/glutamyl-tRNA(Gln) amidotransferase subunit A
MSFADARKAIARKETSCEELVSSFLARIDADNERLNAFIYVDREGALGHARYLDDRLARGDDRPLAGLVLAVKDNICIRGRNVTCGSRMLEQFESLIDATAIARLRDLGAVFIGKTNCDEFGMGSSNENSLFGPVRHPADPDRVPGGSSGGSAVAVAAGMCHAALGTDTGGSVRQPSAFCGIVGLKPTYGRVSRYGLVAYASSLDTIGQMATSVEDVALLLNAVAGRDDSDATSAPVEVPDYTAALTGSVKGLRVGLPKEYFAEGLSSEIRDAVLEQAERLRAQGAEVVEVSLPHTGYGVATYYVIATAEASSNLARYDGMRYGYRAEAAAKSPQGISPLESLYARSRTEGFGTEVKRRIMLGTYVLSSGYYDAYYGKAQRVRSLIRSDFDRAFESVDVLLTPATPTLPYRLGEKVDDPLAMYLGDIFTVTANLAGIPGLVLPAPRREGELPLGVQLLGRHFDEALLLQVGAAMMQPR